MSFSGSMSSQTAYPHRMGFLNEPNHFGQQYAARPHQYASAPHGLPLPPGGERYKNDPRAKWMPFFGANPQVYEKPAEYQYERDVLNMPEGFHGNCDHIDIVLMNMISKADMWPIREALPWRSNNNSLTIKWNIWKYNDHLLSRTPEQSVSRLLTQQYDERSDTMVRYGIALMLEHGFMNTPQGVLNYFANLQQIKNATLETLMLGVQEAILYVDRAVWNSSEQTALQSKDDLLRVEAREMQYWGIVQKNEMGIFLLMDDLKDEFQKVNGTAANYLIVPQSVLKYAATRPSSGMFLMGHNTRISASDRMSGLTVREWRPARVGDGQASLDLAKINAVIGGFVPVKMNHLKNVPPEEFRTQFMNVRTHDERSDDYFWIDYKRLHEICGLFERNPNSNRPRGNGFGGPYLDRMRQNIGGTESRWGLTRAGADFVEGCSSWGDYMEQHGLLTNWVRSFMAKGKDVKDSFLADIAGRHLPGPRFRTETAGRNSQYKRLYYSEVMQELTGLMQNQAGNQGGAGNAGNQAGNQRAWGRDGQYGRKLYARAMYTALKARPPTLAQLNNVTVPDEKAVLTEPQAALLASQNLATILNDGQPSPVFVPIMLAADTNGAPLEILMPGVRNGTPNYLRRRVADNGTVLRKLLAGLLFSTQNPGAGPAALLQAWNASPGTVADDAKWDPAQTLFEKIDINNAVAGIGGTLSVRADGSTVREQVYGLMKNEVKTNNGADIVGIALADGTFAGRLHVIETKRLSKETKATDGKTQSPIKWLPDKIVQAIAPPGELDGAEEFYGDKITLTNAALVERHKEDLAAVYSRRGPKSTVQGITKFSTEDAFVRLIRAVFDGARTMQSENTERELAITLFLNDLYHGALQDIIAALRDLLVDDSGLDDLNSEVRCAMARLVLLYNDVGSKMLDILARMHSNSVRQLEAARGIDVGVDLGVDGTRETRLRGLAQDEKGIPPAVAAARRVGEQDTWTSAQVEDLVYSIQVTNADLVFWSLNNDCWPLIFFNVLAPSMEYITSPTVLMGAYGAAGYTYHGQHSFELGDDATLKIHYGHFTLNARSVIIDHRKICVRHNTFVHAYVAGNDASFWNALDPRDRDEWRNGLHTKSRLVQPYWPDDEDANNSYRINITGYEHSDVRSRSDKPCPLAAPITARLWMFKHPTLPHIEKPYLEAMADYQTVCYMSHYQGCKYIGNGQFDPAGETFLDKGHWGPDNGYPGCAGVRNGKRMWMERPNFSALSMRSNVVSSGFAAGLS